MLLNAAWRADSMHASERPQPPTERREIERVRRQRPAMPSSACGALGSRAFRARARPAGGDGGHRGATRAGWRPEALAGRRADPQRAGDPRATVQAQGAGRLLVGRAVVGGLRAAGDAGRPARGGHGGAGVGPADRDRRRRAAGDRGHQLSADDLRLPVRRRQLHRGARQPRRAAGPGRRRRADRRLHPDRVGLDRLGGRPAGLGRPDAAELEGPAGRRRDRAGHAGQPARHPRVGLDLRRPDLRLPGRHVRA